MARRKHPLIPLVIWLGICLIAALGLLLLAVSQIPPQPQADLEAIHQQGMALGNMLCGR